MEAIANQSICSIEATTSKSPTYSRTVTMDPGRAAPGQIPQAQMLPQQSNPGAGYYAAPIQPQGTLPQPGIQYQGPMMVQQGFPMQLVQPQGQMFQMATPLAALNMGGAPVDCPACGQRGMTAVSYEAGGTSQ
jgi:lipopolysaccharide-induced tumor necrosis factor-alpha factor